MINFWTSNTNPCDVNTLALTDFNYPNQPGMYNFKVLREKGWDLTQSYDKSPYTYKKSKKQRDNTKNATKNFDYTTIADRLRTVSWSKNSYPTGVV